MINQKKNTKNTPKVAIHNPLRIMLLTMLWMFLSAVPVFSQTGGEKTITVSGSILDANNDEPITGATVKVENGTTGTISDINGNFSLKVPENSVLRISFVGYVTQKVKATSIPLTLKMQEDAAKLDEVVVVGYGQVKRANLTGAVSSIAMKEVQDFPAPNLSTVLEGRMPGVHVNEPTGNVIGDSKLTVRINGSFATSGEPLYVIDGFIRDNAAFHCLDPSEIKCNYV